MSDKPIDPKTESTVPGERGIDKPELPKQGYVLFQYADTETVEGKGQLKVGRHRQFEVYCDEPERLGGNDEYPQPLTYIAMGVGY